MTTFNQAGVADSVKMTDLKTLVTGKARTANNGMAYSGAMYQVALQTLEHHFRRPELFVNAQLRKLHSYPFIKAHDSSEIIKFLHVDSECVNVLSEFRSRKESESELRISSERRCSKALRL